MDAIVYQGKVLTSMTGSSAADIKLSPMVMHNTVYNFNFTHDLTHES